MNRGGGPQHAVTNHNNRETRLNTNLEKKKFSATFGLRSQFFFFFEGKITTWMANSTK